MSQMVLAWQGTSMGGEVGCASHLWLSGQYLPSRYPLSAPTENPQSSNVNLRLRTNFNACPCEPILLSINRQRQAAQTAGRSVRCIVLRNLRLAVPGHLIYHMLQAVHAARQTDQPFVEGALEQKTLARVTFQSWAELDTQGGV